MALAGAAQRVGKDVNFNRLLAATLFIGGVTAVIMELAELGSPPW